MIKRGVPGVAYGNNHVYTEIIGNFFRDSAFKKKPPFLREYNLPVYIINLTNINKYKITDPLTNRFTVTILEDAVRAAAPAAGRHQIYPKEYYVRDVLKDLSKKKDNPVIIIIDIVNLLNLSVPQVYTWLQTFITNFPIDRLPGLYLIAGDNVYIKSGKPVKSLEVNDCSNQDNCIYKKTNDEYNGAFITSYDPPKALYLFNTVRSSFNRAVEILENLPGNPPAVTAIIKLCKQLFQSTELLDTENDCGPAGTQAYTSEIISDHAIKKIGGNTKLTNKHLVYNYKYYINIGNNLYRSIDPILSLSYIKNLVVVYNSGDEFNYTDFCKFYGPYSGNVDIPEIYMFGNNDILYLKPKEKKNVYDKTELELVKELHDDWKGNTCRYGGISENTAIPAASPSVYIKQIMNTLLKCARVINDLWKKTEEKYQNVNHARVQFIFNDINTNISNYLEV